MKLFMLHPEGYYQRPMNHQPDLFDGALRQPLQRRGHELVSDIEQADIIGIDMEVWDLGDRNDGTPKGTYTTYSEHSKDYILKNSMAAVLFDNLDHHGWPDHYCTWPAKNNWDDLKPILNQDWAKFIFTLGKNDQVKVYFLRKMQLSAPYPDWVYPLEYPLFDDYPLVTKEELASRPYDVCFLAETSWIRAKAIECIKKDGRLNADLQHIPSNKRMTKEDWVDRHRKSKMFLEIDSTMGSERPMRLMTIAPMLRVKSDHKLPFPRTDGVHQIEIGDYDGTINSNDIDKVLSVIRDPERLYAIYVQGAEHMRQCYSLNARSTYIIDTIESKLCK